jgi:hypothetical protein
MTKATYLKKRAATLLFFLVYIYIARWSSKKMQDSRAEVEQKMYDERAKKWK